jgi:carbon-monoxide dehydrogenase small subunit
MEINQNLVPIRFTVNGKDVEVEVGAGETALFTIRERLGLKGTKEGCGIGECGACTIVVDGMAVNACLMLGAQLDGREVLTVEGLSPMGELSAVQQSFLDHHAVQCGFCTPGILMSVNALFKKNPKPSHKDIVKGISGNLCRCTGYTHIVSAIEDVAMRLSKEKEP